MKILNYTTAISAEKTTAEIQRLLASAKAERVLFDYSDGVVTGISFQIKCPTGLLSFCLPGRVQEVHQALVRQQVQPRYRTMDQAARVAWRIIKDWLSAQLTLIHVGMVDAEQVFLPYMQTRPSGKTFYDLLKEGEFKPSLFLEEDGR